jgi:restriction system protein
MREKRNNGHHITCEDRHYPLMLITLIGLAILAILFSLFARDNNSPPKTQHDKPKDIFLSAPDKPNEIVNMNYIPSLERQAEIKSKAAEEAIEAIQNILKDAVNKVETFSWEPLKDISSLNDIEKSKTDYFNNMPQAIIRYCELVLSKSVYPEGFPKDFAIDYNPHNKVLIVEYTLPSPDDMPKIKEVKYNRSKNQLVTKYLTESFIHKLYDDVIYQIALRTIYELYSSDVINAIESIVFNGWTKSVDKATGNQIKPCILSIQSNRQEFLSLNLKDVDPKLCFKNLKGVGSAKLFSLTPIAPILNISREDKRFVSSHKVVDALDDSFNLAIMDWEDFEHLIRELFEKEFSQSGGEVKITRASRDSGVDAVAFDPDPIRGGKIVIQAKRYTNTVGLSAVRDLYGTVLNEGATKGILVTTTDYGPDAYEFAKGKPLTLLNGSNLLHLLDKHGHKAIINLKEAKQILSEKDINK